MENNQSIPGSREEIVAAAFKNGWVKSVADRNAERNQTIMPVL